MNKKNSLRNMIGKTLLIVTIFMNVLLCPVYVNAKCDISSDLSVYFYKNNTYYLMDYLPPTRYGKEFGKASYYTAKKARKVLLNITWSEPNKNELEKTIGELSSLIKIYFSGLKVGDLLKYECKGIKVTRTTTYNKNTMKFRVGKNKKCRKEVWCVYFKVRDTKTGKFNWMLISKNKGFHSEIKH